MPWRAVPRSANDQAGNAAGRHVNGPVEHLFALALGFAVAGLIASGYQLVTRRPRELPPAAAGRAALDPCRRPVLAFAAPFIIMRNTVRGRRIEAGASAW